MFIVLVSTVWLWSSHLTSLGTNFPQNRVGLGSFPSLILWLLVHDKAFTGWSVVLSIGIFWENSFQVLFTETHRGERVKQWGWPEKSSQKESTCHCPSASVSSGKGASLRLRRAHVCPGSEHNKRNRVSLCCLRYSSLRWDLSSPFRLLNSNSFTVIRDDAFAGLFHLEYL